MLGLVLQNIVPRLMLDQVPAETIHAQIGHILEQYRAEAQRLVDLTCGDAAVSEGDRSDARRRRCSTLESRVGSGSVRQVGRVQGKVVQSSTEANWVPGSEALISFYRDQVEPYLRARSGTRMRLGIAGTIASDVPRPQDSPPCCGAIRWRSAWLISATSAGNSIFRRGCTSGCTRGWEFMLPSRSP